MTKRNRNNEKDGFLPEFIRRSLTKATGNDGKEKQKQRKGIALSQSLLAMTRINISILLDSASLHSKNK